MTVGLAGVSDGDGPAQETGIPWSNKATGYCSRGAKRSTLYPARTGRLMQSVVRALAWMRDLEAGRCVSVETLAEANRVHPKVVRQAWRLSPDCYISN